MANEQSGPDDLGQDAEFPDDAIDDDEVSAREQLLLDRKELRDAGLTLDNPDQYPVDLAKDLTDDE